MGYSILPLAHSILLFIVIRLFEKFLEPRGKIPQVAYLEPTLGHFIIIILF